MERWPRWLYDDGNGVVGMIQAKSIGMAVSILARQAGGHHAVRDIDGERDEREHHDCRHCGWEVYFIVDERGRWKDWVALTPAPGEDART